MTSECKVLDCKSKKLAKNFCKKHYSDWFHQRRDFEGNPINGYKPLAKECRFPKCGTKGSKKNSLRNGLCNKHRKWSEKGIINPENCEIIDPERLPKLKEWLHCKMPKCIKKHKAKGFCSNHYRSFIIYKTIDIKGNHIGKKRKYTYDSKCLVINCFKKDKLIKNMCKHHYTQYTKGIITQDGFKARDLKKIHKYPEGTKCKIPKCKNQAKLNWYCRSCNDKIRFGSLSPEGKLLGKVRFVNINKKCSKRDCNEPAYCRKLCKTHYSRDQYGYTGPSRFINVGKTCSLDNCEKPAAGRGMCSKHYREKLSLEKMGPGILNTLGEFQHVH